MPGTGARGRWIGGALAVGVVMGLAGCGADGPVHDLVGGGADAACAMPITQVTPTTASPGTEVTVTGTFWCNDTPNDPQPQQATGLDIVWQQGEHQVVLATADTDAGGELSVTVTIPADAVTGEATIAAGYADPATVSVQP